MTTPTDPTARRGRAARRSTRVRTALVGGAATAALAIGGGLALQSTPQTTSTGATGTSTTQQSSTSGSSLAVSGSSTGTSHATSQGS